jgi:hypothetical protein
MEKIMAAIRQDKQAEASTPIQRKPSQEALPEIAWLRIADLLVDYSYQHRPYSSAIDALHKDFQQRYSGFILVNQRADGSMWILDGQTRYAVHQLREIHWIRAEMLHGLTQAQEAEVYLLKCINAKRMPVDFFLAEFVAQRPVAVLIHDVLEKRGIEIESYATTQRHRGMDTTPVVTCVSYLKRMIAREPKDEKGNPTGDILGMTLDLIHDTWEYSGNSLTAIFLDSLHKIIVAHDDELDRRAFIAKLEGHRPEELREQALLLRLGTKPLLSTGTALQRVMIDLYNSGRREDRRITLGSPHRS